MRRLGLFLIALTILGIVASADAWNRAMPAEYGRVIIGNYTKGTGLAPVVFDHWLHRSLFTCRLCHADIGFAMKAGGTNIKAATNIQGYHCGACHDGKKMVNGKVLFASCVAEIPKEGGALCDRCHSQGKKVKKEYDFAAFTEKLPKTALGNGIDWEEAEAKGLIKPLDFLEGVSMKRDPLKTQNDFAIQMKANWIGEVIFSHKKHASWNGCEVCHPEIFPSVRKGTTNYTMFEIIEGRYCGVCHDKVAFPFQDCSRCHTKPVKFGTGSPR